MSQVCSSTNWNTNTIVWNDGNDFHDMDDAVLLEAHENGNVASWPILRSSGFVNYQVGVMPIKVIVYDPTPTQRSSWGQVKAIFR